MSMDQDSSGVDTHTGQFNYGVAMFISVLAIILLITLTSFICTRLHLSYLLTGATTTVLRPSRRSNTTTAASDPDHSFVYAVDLGLDDATINSYPQVMYSQAKLHGCHKEASCCSICLGEYKESDVLRVLPDCGGHLFHKKCVDPWLRLNPSCPICRHSPLPSPLPTPLAEVAPLAAAP